MSKPFRSAIRIICFLAVLCLVLAYVCQVLKPKNDEGIYDMQLFYELPEDSVELLVLGSEYAAYAFNTGTLWREQGIPAFILSGYRQPMWNSYHYLIEALKTQTPGLVILEASMAAADEPYMDDISVIRNTFGMKWSRNRIEAIKASVPKARWTEFLLSCTQYHGRYKEITFNDVLPYKGDVMYENWKGTRIGNGPDQYDADQTAGVTERKSLEPRTEEYYRKIIELCREKDIPLLIAVAPHAATEQKQTRFNTAADIAGEYRVPFIAVTPEFNDYLAENYNFPDHREDEKKYSTWDRDAEYLYKRMGIAQ